MNQGKQMPARESAGLNMVCRGKPVYGRVFRSLCSCFADIRLNMTWKPGSNRPSLNKPGPYTKPQLIFRLHSLLLTLVFSLSVLAEPATDALSDIPGDSPAEVDKCDKVPEQDALPEKLQSGVHELSCRGVRWIDSLFGDSQDFEEEAVGGKFLLGMRWNEFEGLDFKGRYQVRSDLPNFSSRWDAMLGKLDEDAFVSGTETQQTSVFRQGISEENDNEWLFGLGYKDRSSSGDGWDHSIGLRLQTPVRLYGKSRYRKSMQLSPVLDLRFRQTFFWRDGIGFGTTTHIDTSRELSDLNILRWELVGTISEDTEGTRWWAGNTWYHNLGDQRGISLLTFARGETDDVVSLHEYGFELTWRRQLTREWLFVNVGPTLTWPRLKHDQKREASFGFVVTMEFEFGQFRG